MDLNIEGREPASGFDSIFCPKCGCGPDVTQEPVIVYPRSAYGKVRYRYPCSNRPGCLNALDLDHSDLRVLYKQVRISQLGQHIDSLDRVRRRLLIEMDDAAEPKDRIAATRELRRLTREHLEDAQIVDRRPSFIAAESAKAIKVLPGTLVERKLKERVQAKLADAMHEAADAAEREAEVLSVPEPVEAEVDL